MVFAIITLSPIVVELLARRNFLVTGVHAIRIVGVIATSVADVLEQRRRSTRSERHKTTSRSARLVENQ